MACHLLLQGIFLTQGLHPGLPRCRQMLYPPSHQGRQGSHKALAAQRILSTLKVTERGGEMKIKGSPGYSEAPGSTVFRWSQTYRHFLHSQWLSQGRVQGPDYLEQCLAHRTLSVTVHHQQTSEWVSTRQRWCLTHSLTWHLSPGPLTASPPIKMKERSSEHHTLCPFLLWGEAGVLPFRDAFL